MHTIYLVDDDPHVLSSMQFLLEAEGFKVETFASGVDLLSCRSLSQADCLVIDCNMAGMDGLQTIRLLRERQVFMPVVVITADERLAAQASAFGVAHVVMKPHLRESLIDHIATAMHDNLSASPPVDTLGGPH